MLAQLNQAGKAVGPRHTQVQQHQIRHLRHYGAFHGLDVASLANGAVWQGSGNGQPDGCPEQRVIVCYQDMDLVHLIIRSLRAAA
ncbi:hypothetical protein B3C1_04250 [Gallaecimonas xiamenensis 3-C-1]|uniref:Uncharacterized protein n=1 Tax=Gallaecimonas xiamenensis 3-C-1 TaxID=745411 RepID=K2JQG9_9GAMM|nr:hypothetical protein B3C1_04250 [Gallaecimonas xiamenensis 3-C-1]